MITKLDIFPAVELNARIKKYAFFCLIVCFLWACNSTEVEDNPVKTNLPEQKTPTSLPEGSSLENQIVPPTIEIFPTSMPHQDRTERPRITIVPEIINPEDFPNNNPIIGEVPEEILTNIFVDVLQRTDADNQSIQVIKAEVVTWNDGSLGCPKPGEFYTQALVHGYWVILQIDKKNYDYRVSNSGHFFLCEGKGDLPISPPEISPPQK